MALRFIFKLNKRLKQHTVELATLRISFQPQIPAQKIYRTKSKPVACIVVLTYLLEGSSDALSDKLKLDQEVVLPMEWFLQQVLVALWLQMNVKLLKGRDILGGCAGRFHSVVYTADGVYTCGLNAGQIGQWCCAVFGVTCERDSFGFVKVP